MIDIEGMRESLNIDTPFGVTNWLADAVLDALAAVEAANAERSGEFSSPAIRLMEATLAVLPQVAE